MDAQRKILIVNTSAEEYIKAGYRTGLWLSELTHFYDVMEAAGVTMDLASPQGGRVPIDPESLLLTESGEAMGLTGSVARRYQDRAFMNRLSDTRKLTEVSADDYDGIYLTGGHGTMFDFPDHPALARLIAEIYEDGGIVSAVCHGPAGLLDVKLKDGDHLLRDRDVTGFSWKEERLAKRDEAVPFSLEKELQRRGARYSKALLPFNAHVVVDGRLITGQNPKSAHGVAEAVLRRLRADHAEENRDDLLASADDVGPGLTRGGLEESESARSGVKR